jgi:hypothetical protein
VPPGEADAERRLARRLLTIPPKRAAEAILRGVERRRARVLIGASAVLPDLVQRAAPTLIGRVLGARDAASRAEHPAEPSPARGTTDR